MVQVSICLKNGKEYTFKIKEDNKLTRDNKRMLFISDNNTSYTFATDDVSAEIYKNCIKCPTCGEEMIPDKSTCVYDGRYIVFNQCSECHADIDNEFLKTFNSLQKGIKPSKLNMTEGFYTNK